MTRVNTYQVWWTTIVHWMRLVRVLMVGNGFPMLKNQDNQILLKEAVWDLKNVSVFQDTCTHTTTFVLMSRNIPYLHKASGWRIRVWPTVTLYLNIHCLLFANVQKIWWYWYSYSFVCAYILWSKWILRSHPIDRRFLCAMCFMGTLEVSTQCSCPKLVLLQNNTKGAAEQLNCFFDG